MKALLILLGIVTITTFLLMRRNAMDFYSNGKSFTIFDLECPESKADVTALIDGLDIKAKTAVLDNLDTDYLFMVGIFPLIMLLNLIALRNLNYINAMRNDIMLDPAYRGWRILLIIFIASQLIAWGLDLTENVVIEKWITTGIVNTDTAMFTLRTIIKFILSVGGFLVGLSSWLLTNRIIRKTLHEKDSYMGLSPL